MGDRYVKPDENKKVMYIDASILYGHPIAQPIFYDENKFDRIAKIQVILSTLVDSEIGFFEVVSKYPNLKKRKNEDFPFLP